MTASAQKSVTKASATSLQRRPPQRHIGSRSEFASALDAMHVLHSRAGNRAVTQMLGSGTPLSPQTRVEMENRFGDDFGSVRIHNDARAHASATLMEAKAYTTGNDIVFSAGRFAPHASEGKRLLAHELAHVIQQRRGGAPPVLVKNAPHELSADRAAASVMQTNGAVAVEGATGVGVARDADEGAVQGGARERVKRVLADALLRAGMPPAGSRLAGAVALGMGEELAQELIHEGKGVMLLAHIAAMTPADYLQLEKGYLVGLVEGIVSPVTDLFGLGVFVERMQNLSRDLIASAFKARGDITAEWQSLESELANVRHGVSDAWGNAKKDPTGTIVTLLSLPDAITAYAEKKAYELGKQGGSAIVASLEAPWKAKKDEENKPKFLESPLAWVESKAKAGEDWILDTPWSQIGSKIGYAIGFVAIQVILFAFTEGLGNAIEEAGVALGKVASALGKLSEAIGSVAGRVARLVTTIGEGISAVEQAIAFLAGKALKPLEKILEPVLEPLGKFFERLRAFLRKLFGVAEKDGAQLVDAAAGKLGGAGDEAGKLKTNTGLPDTNATGGGTAASAKTPVTTAAKDESFSAGGSGQAGGASTANEDLQAAGTGNKAAKSKTEAGTAAGGGTDPHSATPSQKPAPQAKSSTSKPTNTNAASQGGTKTGGTGAGAKTPTSAAKKPPQIYDPHGMRPDLTNFDRRTAGAGGIDRISFLKDPEGRYAVKIEGELQPGLYRGEGKPPPGKIKAPDYNRSSKLITNKEAGLGPDWENSHLWGPGFGDEAAAGIMKAPKDVNQWYQGRGAEQWMRDMRDLAAKGGGKVEVEATAIAWDLEGSAWQPKAQVDFLRRAEYRVNVKMPGQPAQPVRITIDVARPPGTKVLIDIDPPSAVNPGNLFK